MKTLIFLLQKEFKQIFRNKILLALIFIIPVVQLLIFPLAADYEMKNISIVVVDHDHSPYSRKLISKIVASGYFNLYASAGSFEEAFRFIENDKADLVLEIPKNFERELVVEKSQQLFIAANAINGIKAGLGGAYINRIIVDFNTDVRLEWIQPERFNAVPVIQVTSSNRFNPGMNYRFFMVPGILVFLVTLVASYMCALNTVREKEIGTIEQINVTPIKKYQFILGKLIPFWVIGVFVFTVGLFIVARLVYGIIPLGSITLLFAYLAVYLVAMLGLGLLVSTYCQTQQQVMFVMFFFMMIFVLMSGLFTPIESMPAWAYVIARCNPVTYFMEVIRMVVLKGSRLADIRLHFIVMFGFALLFNLWAVIHYKKTT
ncbi:ABC transporter permease [uncultured Proteiniphilum sp.]|uniref:ABC transporter permease n=1 Tax=uncultured Proteiniphilum sp. TaxID=497637 RepID=UPI002621AE76|nr:ABC transporter permease [uncultured Proteiniphilum sp.]